MIVVRTPEHALFNYAECEHMFNGYKKELKTDETFDNVIKNSDFYSFYIWQTGELIGCIYYYNHDDKLFVNAFAARGHHEINLECFKMSLSWYDCDIYAEATEKTSRLCVAKCGFEKIKDNLFIYRR